MELFDDEGSGYVNIKTFKITMTTQGARIGEDEFHEITKNVSTNEGGDIDIDGEGVVQVIVEIYNNASIYLSSYL